MPGLRTFLRSRRWPQHGRWRHFVVVALLLGAAPAWSQALWGPLQVGMSEAELHAAVPQAVRTARPDRLPNGLRGNWHLAGTELAGQSFDTTFYFKEQGLREVAQTLSSGAAGCGLQPAFDAVVAQLRTRYGGERLASDPPAAAGSVSATTVFWSRDGVDVAAALSVWPGRCLVRVSYKPQVLVDAGQL